MASWNDKRNRGVVQDQMMSAAQAQQKRRTHRVEFSELNLRIRTVRSSESFVAGNAALEACRVFAKPGPVALVWFGPSRGTRFLIFSC